MRLRIGIAVAQDSVRIVALRDGHIDWAGESPVTLEVPLAAAVGQLLAQAPVKRWPRPRIVAAIGPAQAQVKPLSGLPAVADARNLSRIIRESPGRFFLKNGVPLTITDVWMPASRQVWAGAFDQPVVQLLTDACRRRGLTLRSVVPTAWVLGRALQNETIVWQDGDVAAHLSFRDGELSAIRRLTTFGADDAHAPSPCPTLHSLGEDAWRFADAYGAATIPENNGPATRPGRIEQHVARAVPAWRLRVASTVFVVAAAVATLTPGLAAERAALRAERTLRALGPRRAKAVRAETELSTVTSALDGIAAFERSRRSSIAFLATLTRALPSSAQLVAVAFDTAGGTLVALAPRAGTVASAVERLDDIAAIEIVGPVTRETVGAEEKERVTIRYRWRVAAAREGR